MKKNPCVIRIGKVTLFFLLASASACAFSSAWAAPSAQCTKWYNEVRLNLEPVPIPAEVADFIRKYKFSLLEIARKDQSALVLFKDRRLPRGGESIESRLDLRELSERLFIFDKPFIPWSLLDPFAYLGTLGRGGFARYGETLRMINLGD